MLTILVAATSSLFAHGRHGNVAAMGAVGVDGPTLFIWGTILVLAFVSVLLIADSSRDDQTFVAQAATTPGSAEERAAQLAGVAHPEIYPLTLFAVAGMLLFPASNDLLTMFVALEVLSLPLYLLCGLARRRRLLSQEASMKYFLLGVLPRRSSCSGWPCCTATPARCRWLIASAASSNVGSLTLLYAGIQARDVAHQFIKIVGGSVMPQVQSHMSQVLVLVNDQRLLAKRLRQERAEMDGQCGGPRASPATQKRQNFSRRLDVADSLNTSA